MRYALVFASSLAVGALAGPIEKRAYEYAINVVETTTIEVTVTEGQQALAIPTGDPYGHGGQGHGPDYGQGPNRSSAKATSSSTSCTSSSSAAAAVPAPSSVEVPSYEPAPQPSPSSSAVEVPAAPEPTYAPTTAPAPEPSAPAPSSAPPAPQPTDSAGDLGPHNPGPQQAEYCNDQNYQDSVLWHHNRARKNHGVAPLQWSADCVAGARKAAETCIWAHLETKGQGQNMFATSGHAANATAGVTEAFYKPEADLYPAFGNGKEPNMVNFHDWGHMTALVWKGTTHVGCVTIDCPGNATNMFTVCNYSPGGNVPGQYANNVFAPLGDYSGYHWTD